MTWPSNSFQLVRIWELAIMSCPQASHAIAQGILRRDCQYCKKVLHWLLKLHCYRRLTVFSPTNVEGRQSIGTVIVGSHMFLIMQRNTAALQWPWDLPNLKIISRVSDTLSPPWSLKLNTQYLSTLSCHYSWLESPQLRIGWPFLPPGTKGGYSWSKVKVQSRQKISMFIQGQEEGPSLLPLCALSQLEDKCETNTSKEVLPLPAWILTANESCIRLQFKMPCQRIWLTVRVKIVKIPAYHSYFEQLSNWYEPLLCYPFLSWNLLRFLQPDANWALNWNFEVQCEPVL